MIYNMFYVLQEFGQFFIYFKRDNLNDNHD